MVLIPIFNYNFSHSKSSHPYHKPKKTYKFVPLHLHLRTLSLYIQSLSFPLHSFLSLYIMNSLHLYKNKLYIPSIITEYIKVKTQAHFSSIIPTVRYQNPRAHFTSFSFNLSLGLYTCHISLFFLHILLSISLYFSPSLSTGFQSIKQSLQKSEFLYRTISDW